MTAADEGWEGLRRKTPLIGIATLFLLFFGLFWGFHGIVALVDTRYLAAAFYLPAGSGCLILAVSTLAIVVWRRRSGLPTRIDPIGPGGVSIMLPVTYRAGYLAVFVLTLVSSAVFAFGVWTDRLTFPMTGGQFALFPYVAAALALYAAGALLFRVSGRLRFPEILCTPTTLAVQTSRVRDEIAWDDIVSVEPTVSGNSMAILVEPRDGAKVAVEVFYRGPLAPSPEDPIVCNVDLFPVGPEALLDFLRYYLDRPESRAELDNGRAVERLRQ
ncbi:hypothetical protein IA539_07470 [Gordonia sp. zg691]|uniref:hypothetical protein n=1 Tax=Gordonia jinghuaiqii TaxID=2758710 RepID=UPI0016624867|nr:hypothetical protein [Gordonia jinghuaiqii]MBD0861053.1 hypothetical protein [Gordonia jinghuaiqii]